MKKELYKLLGACMLLFFPLFNQIIAQDNLQVDFANAASVPDFLNICGDTDTEVVRVSVDGLAPETRSQIFATAHLFKGVELVSFDAANSSAGVIPEDLSDPANPIFRLPDLSPFATTFVDIAFTVKANCEYIDTLTANNAAEVYDLWEFDYNLGATTGINEFDANIEYRDAFAIPSFTIDVINSFGPARVGDCYSREILTTNSGLDGFVDTIFYSNTQGAGVYVESILVNGIPVIPNKQVVGPDTLITLLIDGTHFVNNTIGGGPGDADVFFDPDETVTIVENICVLDFFEDRTSFHSVEWGCEGRLCETVSINGFADIGQGAANLVFADNGSLPNINTGYCQAGQSTITFTNDGLEVDPGFATMMSVSTGIGIGNAFGLTDAAFQITGIRIAGVDITVPSAMVDLDGNLQFTTDPDGAGGLTDFDGDGFFDDLPQNESIEITAFYEFDCSLATSPGMDSTCANSFTTAFNARIDHTNACDERIVRLEPSYFRPSQTRAELENFTDPDAFALTDTFYITHTQTRGVRFFEKSCSGNEQLLVTVVLPPGISVVAGVTEVIRNESTSYPLIGNTMSNDTTYLVFDASTSPFINGEYEVIIALQADCTAPLGPTSFPMEFAHYCPDCDCKHTWFCGDLEGPTLHSTDPPCPPIACPIGLRTMDFDVNRTTFGYTDETYTTPYDPNLANRKVAISCDSVEMRILNVVGDTPVNDSLGMVITYNNVDGSLDPEETFLFGLGTLRITNGGTEYFCTVDTSILDVQAVDSTKFLTFDLDPCLTGLGITLNPGDTVDFRANFTINPDGPYPVQFKKVQNLRGYGYARFDGVDESCDNFGDIITIAKNQTVFNFPNSSSFPEGCDEVFLRYQLITVNNGFVDWFGNEFRQAIGVDSLVFTFDTAVYNSFDVFEPQVSIPNHPIHGNDFFPMPLFEEFPDGRYMVRFDTLTAVPSLNNVLSYSFNFRIRAIPNCKSLTGSINGNNRFDFDPEIFYQDRYYANDIGDGSCSELVVNSVDNDIFYTDPPTFSLNYVSNPNFNLAADTATWIIQHCNTSFTADAGVTWISVEDSTQAIQVVSIEDISDPMNVVSLPVSSFGASGENYFAFAPGLIKGDGSAPIEDVCNTLRITALVNECGITNFDAKVGWNCVMYTEPNWNPELYPPCEDMVIPLSVTTLDPFLDGNIIEQPVVDPNLCDTNTIAILVRNTDQGSAYDVTTQLILPFDGAEIVPGSVEFAYPPSAPYQSIATDPYFAGTNSRGRIFQYYYFSLLNTYLDGNGLPGFNPASPTDSNEFVIRYKFTTDCDYISGSISYYQLQGLKGCGDSTNFETGETLPIEINGADPGVSKIFDVHFNDGSVLTPGAATTIEITAVNLTTTPTDTTDKILLTLPTNINYEAGSTIAIDPPTWAITEPEIEIDGGFQNLYWCFPAGLIQNDSVTMRLVLNSPTYDCSIDSLDVGLYTILRQDLTCSANGLDCGVESITSSNNGALTRIDVNQRSLDIDLTFLTSTCVSPTEEQVTIDGIVLNTGTDFIDPNFTIRYFYDVDNSGGYSVGDTELANFTENGPIITGDAVPFQHTLIVDVAEFCQVFGMIDTTGLNLCDDALFSIDNAQLLNAGNDILICETVPTTVTANLGEVGCSGFTTYTYEWFAIPPATTADLSSTTILNPVLTTNFDGVTEDTLVYYLETTRPGCVAISRDTVRVILGAGLTVDLGSTITTNGNPVVLNTNTSGGTAPYTYDWEPAGTLDNPNAAQPIATPIQDSTLYTVTVTSATGCTGVDSVLVINSGGTAPCTTPPVTSVAIVEATCGNNDGEVVIHVEGDEANYIYSWMPDIGIPNADNNQRIGLPAGGYTVVISDPVNALCSRTLNILVQNSDGPTATATITPATCGFADGIVDLVPASFNYLWDDTSTASNRTDLAAGIYFVTFTDPAAPDCPNVLEIEIEEESDLEATLMVNNLPDCGLANGSATINVSGGVGPFSFSWGDNTATQNNLSSGVYTVTITDLGTGGCELEYTFALTDNVASAIINITDTTEVRCAGADNGNIDFTVSYDLAFVLPADTIITDGVNIYNNGDIPAGDYCLIIRDGNGCLAGESCFTMPEPDSLLLWFTVTPACENDGSVDLEILGGIAPFTIDWDFIPGSPDQEDIDNLIAGTYPIQVTDANGCTINDFVDVGPCECTPPQLNSILIIEATCGNSDGSATIHMVDNDSLYNYNWLPDVGTSIGIGNTRNNLPFGGYVVEVSSISDPTCMTEVFVLVTNSDGPAAGAMTTPATCLANDGTATLTPADYLYVWEDLSVGNFRDTLSAGIYFVTLTDTISNPDCPNVLMLEIEEDTPLTATLSVDTVPDCGVSNGTVTINVMNGSGAYEFTWEDGLITTNATRSNLSSGAYTVTITDTDVTGCELEFLFVLEDNVGTATLTLDDTSHVTCADFANGGIDFTINFDPAFALPADTVITDGTYYYENGNLPAGDYCIYIGDGAGCLVTSACFTIDEPDAMDLYLVLTPACDDNGCVEVTINGGTAPFTYDWSHLMGGDDPADICGLSAETYGLSVTDSLGCLIIEDAIIIPACVDSCDFFGGLDTIMIQAPDCQSMATYCFDVSSQDIFQAQILDNGMPYNFPIVGCNFDSLIVEYDYGQLFGQGNLGPYDLISWTVDGNTFGGEFDDIAGLIDSMNTWDPNGNWMASSVGQFIIGGQFGSTYSTMVIEAIDFGATSNLGASNTSLPTGYELQLGVGNHEVVVIDTITGCSDTLFAIVSCTNVFDICVNDTVNYCIDTSTLNLNGTIVSMSSVCLDQANGATEFMLDQDNYCIDYTGVIFGTDTICIEFCDIGGLCDTFDLIVMVDSCVTSEITNIKDTVFINQTEIYCIDTLSLPGEIVSIENYCADLSGDFVDFFIDPMGFCMEYTGVEIGVDSACVVVCDEFGFCDTTLFCVAVVEYLDPPIAQTDTICDPGVLEGTPVVINVQANDTLYGGVDSLYILTEPEWGTATVNLDGSITFNADEQVCERMDSLQYVVCTPTGCDTATVIICIDCVDIVIFTAVSANGDGINDVFYIANIEEYPNSELKIFNRWGNLIYETVNYKNTWDGTWNGNRDLPDGTYYYLLELNDEGNRVFQGFFELYR